MSPRPPIKEVLSSGALLVGDGAMGTELQKAGLEPGGCGDEWNLSHPEKVLTIQRAYVEAGSQLLLTNTFGSNRFVLARYELEARAAEICRAAVQIARQAIGQEGWVLGDVGPCGGFLEPLGDIRQEALEESLREQIGALLDGGVDGIILETMTALEEVEVGIRVAREMGAACVIASMAYDLVRGVYQAQDYKTMMGIATEQAARAAAAAGADVVGANCGASLEPRDFKYIAGRFRSACDLPIMLQPNAGQPHLDGTAVVYPCSPEEMAKALSELTEFAQMVGGCCGTTPAHIRAFRERLN